MYVLQHLRGNAILDAEHRRSEGEAAPPYTEEQLALALITQRTTLTGAFLRAG